jgi:hypothetical protein
MYAARGAPAAGKAPAAPRPARPAPPRPRAGAAAAAADVASRPAGPGRAAHLLSHTTSGSASWWPPPLPLGAPQSPDAFAGSRFTAGTRLVGTMDEYL